MGISINIVQRAKHIDRKPTAEQPYLLDDLIFAATKDHKIVAVDYKPGENEKEKPTCKDLFTGEVYDYDDFYRYDRYKPNSENPMKRLDGDDILECLRNVAIRGLFTGKVYRNLKSYDAFNFPEGGPIMGYRASKEQVAALLKDIQKGYLEKLEKEQQPSQ